MTFSNYLENFIPKKNTNILNIQQSYTLGNGQRESVFSENCLLTSTNDAMMSTGQQSVGLQHGYVNQSYQQPLMSQTNHNLFNDPYVSPTV